MSGTITQKAFFWKKEKKNEIGNFTIDSGLPKVKDTDVEEFKSHTQQWLDQFSWGKIDRKDNLRGISK